MSYDRKSSLSLDPAVLQSGMDDQTARCRALVVEFMAQCVRDAKSHQESAVKWLKDDSERTYSLRWCCEVLDLDPDRVRAAVGSHAGNRRG